MEMTMEQHLKGRSAIVTGAGRGIGREIALLLAKQGAKVGVCDPGLSRGGEQTEERVADEVVGLIKKDGGSAIPLYDSVADYKKAGEMVAKTVAEFGSIDLMINVAGILRERMIWNMSEEDFDLVVGVHLKGMWNMSHHSIKHMRAKGFGRIINFSSSAFKGSVGQANYAAAKAGIIGLSRTIAQEAYKFGITCNAVCPSADTRMTLTPEVKANRQRKLAAGILSQAEYDRQTQPRGPEYIAPLIAYLCTDEAYYLNGQTFHTERGELSNYYFGETMKQITKQEDEGMFTVDELMKKVPEMMKDVPPVAPIVKPSEAQQYVKQR
jgi:NAD(P)-dependent dehydrogenase (short-subunit alcohol dehydrogenase family)